MAMPSRTRIAAIHRAFALLTAGVLGVSGCTSSSAGSPLPPSSSQGENPGSNTPTSQNAAAKLAAMDPCTLLTQAQADQYGLINEGPGTVASARTCSWTHPSDVHGKGGFNLKPGIRDRQGLKDINTSGYSMTDLVIGKHQARQAAEPIDDSCLVSIGVTDSSRVDVVVAGEPGQGCRLANEFARLMEPKLPDGAE